MVFGRKIRNRLLITATLACAALLTAPPASAQMGISVAFAPPSLPVYAQPVCPGEGYLWTPGYWAYGAEGYFWVPGTWVRPPRVGYLWTPAWWGWGGSGYLFHSGYWGPHIGFYGGIHYGFGYTGVGYEGGYWRGRVFSYNRDVNNINLASVHNVYSHPVGIRNAEFNHVSYNGGNGGVPYRASAQELAAQHERHVQPTFQQMQHRSFAAQDRNQYDRYNRGRPATTAARTPSDFRANAASRAGFGRSVINERGGDVQRFGNQRFGNEHSGQRPSAAVRDGFGGRTGGFHSGGGNMPRGQSRGGGGGRGGGGNHGGGGHHR